MAEDVAHKPKAQSHDRIFYADRFGWVIATHRDGGFLRSQTVEAHLLLAILRQLQAKE